MSHLVLDIKSERGLFNLDNWSKYLFLPDSECSVLKIDLEWKGYFINYDQLTLPKLIEVCKAFDTTILETLNSDYLLFGLNDTKSELDIVSGISGKFPLYFSTYKDGITASTDLSEVVRRKTDRKLNVNSALDYLYTDYFMYANNETFIDGIYKLPVGHRLRIDRSFKYKIEPIVNLDKFVNKQHNSLSVEQFQELFLERLITIVQERVRTFPNLPLGCELSSGFDSTLMAYAIKKAGLSDKFTFYSDYSRRDTGDTDKAIVERFALKHKLNLSLCDISDLATFSETDIEWSKKYFFPGTHAMLGEIFAAENRQKKCDGSNILFRGFGADELYMSYLIHHDSKRMIREELEWAKFGIEQGIGKIFTKKGLDILKSYDRFSQTPVYFNILSPSSVEWAIFPIYWEFGQWTVLPFNDLELINIARRIPKKNRVPLKKQEIWKGRTDIFLSEQFKQKLPFDNHVLQIFEKRRKILIETLTNSVLAKNDLINAEEMSKMINQGKGGDTFKGMLPVFINVIWLEIYLQAHGF